MKILITGATGLIGSALTRVLASREDDVRVAVRRPIADLAPNIEQVQIACLSAGQDWTEALRNIDVLVHCAARVHVMNETSDDPLAAFREINVEGSRRLLQQAVAHKVNRFIFVSSIKVNGEATIEGRPFRSSDAPNPADPYGISKWEAEQAIKQTCTGTKTEYCIVRPVLVYGPGVKANFAELIRLVSKGVPLPVGAVENKRSLVALDNLVDLIANCAGNPAAANQTFLVSDGHDLSTAELVREIARCMKRKPRVVAVPPSLLKLGAKLLKREAIADRLLGSLQVDISHTCRALGWKPPVSVFDGLQKTVDSIQRH